LYNDQWKYRCIINDGKCSDSSASALLIVKKNSNNINTNYKSKLICYPNPVKNELIISSDLKHLGSKFEIYDAFGKQIFIGSISKLITSIDFSELNSGVYLLKTCDELPLFFKIYKE
jgi:hypothetical protein